MADRSGQVFGRYTLAQPVFTRGEVEVFEAIDNRLESKAVVWLLPLRAESDIERLNTLVRRLGKMEHPSIAPYTDHGFQNDTAFLVTHYYPGGTLRGLLAQPHLHHDAAQLISPLARAMEYIHGYGVFHGDVHPGNVYLDARGKPLLTGIGIAELMQAGQDVTSSCSSGLLQAAYLAPEQFQGIMSERTDVYALGVIFYELVTGRCPFTADSPEKVLHMKTDEPLPRPKKFVPGLPDSVENIIFKVMAKNPENRYRDMAALAEVLESLAHTKEVVKPLVSADAETVAPVDMRSPSGSGNTATTPMSSKQKNMPSSSGNTATTPMTPVQDEVRTTVSPQQRTELPDTLAGSADAAPPPGGIKYSPTYAAGMAPPPPPAPVAQASYAAAAPAAKRRVNPGIVAAVGAFLFVCLLASAVGGYFWLSSNGQTEEEYIDSMIATGVSQTETAFVTPVSFNSGQGDETLRLATGFQTTPAPRAE